MATGLPKTKWNGEIKESPKRGVKFFELCWQKTTLSLNRLFYGDNLDVLRLLNDDKDVKGKIKLVYIDPPYSTNSILGWLAKKIAMRIKKEMKFFKTSPTMGGAKEKGCIN